MEWDKVNIAQVGMDPDDGTSIVDEIHAKLTEVAQACCEPKNGDKGEVTVKFKIGHTEGRNVVIGGTVTLKKPGRERPGISANLSGGQLLTQDARQVDVMDVLREARESDPERN